MHENDNISQDASKSLIMAKIIRVGRVFWKHNIIFFPNNNSLTDYKGLLTFRMPSNNFSRVFFPPIFCRRKSGLTFHEALSYLFYAQLLAHLV